MVGIYEPNLSLNDITKMRTSVVQDPLDQEVAILVTRDEKEVSTRCN